MLRHHHPIRGVVGTLLPRLFALPLLFVFLIWSGPADASLVGDPECKELFKQLPAALLLSDQYSPVDETSVLLPDGKLRVFAWITILPGFTPSGQVELSLEDKTQKFYFHRDTDSGTYFTDVPPGSYILNARDPSGAPVAPRVGVEVKKPGSPALHVVVAKDAGAYYRSDGALVPFTPQYKYLALVFQGHLPKTTADAIAEKAAQMGLAIRPAKHDADRGIDFVMFEGRVWLFELTDLSRRDEAIVQLRAWIDAPVRIGVPIGLGLDSFHALDGNFIIQFSSSMSPLDRKKWLEEVGAWQVRPLEDASNFSIIRFKTNDYCEALLNVEKALGTVLDTGEPDLMFEVVNAGPLPATWPSDPKYWSNQVAAFRNHKLQKIREAWQILADAFPIQFPPTTGSTQPDVYIASADDGIIPGLNEIACSKPVLAGCYDYPAGIKCSEAGYVPPDSANLSKLHGVAMYGIISACTNNGSEIAAVAPGLRHFAVRRPPVTSWVQYRAMLLWLGGLPVDCGPFFDLPAPIAGEIPCNPFTPLNPPADVINASHTVPWGIVALPVTVSKSIHKLWATGSRGRGTVLVYAAGNFSCNIANYSPLANHKYTLGIANCWVNPSNVEERFPGDTSSNGCDGGPLYPAPPYGPGGSAWGQRIDVCAIGENSGTIPPYCSMGSCTIGGTSAATATVSGVVGMLRSVYPELTASKIRWVLRESADEIDLGQTHVDGAWVNGRSKWYGSGRLNACKAVTLALPFAGISSTSFQNYCSPAESSTFPPPTDLRVK